MALTVLLTDFLGNTMADLSQITKGKKVGRVLNLPWAASGTTPSRLVGEMQLDGYPLLSKGRRRIKVKQGATTLFNGVVVNLEDDGDENSIMTTWTAIDPMGFFWPKRIARDEDGDYSKPSFIETFGTGPQIMEAILNNSIGFEGDLGLDMGAGTIATSGADLSGTPNDWPATIADIFALLNDTGELDVVLTPQDTTDGLMCVFNAYNGDYGTDRTATVHFDYWTGDRSIRRLRREEDMTDACNTLRYLLGPRVGTPADPPGDQHWRGDVQIDDPALPDPPQTDLEGIITTSRSDYGQLMDVRVYDGEGEAAFKELYYRLWQTESLMRANGREMLHATMIRGETLPFTAPGDFDIGDLISFNAGADFRGGFTDAVQRVYGYSLVEDDATGVVELGEIIASADQEAI